MKRSAMILVLTLILLPSGPVPAGAQEPQFECVALGEVDDMIEAVLRDEKAVLAVEPSADAAFAALAVPLSIPSAAKALAPSTLGGMTIADATGFLNLLGLAYEGGLFDASDGLLAFTLSPFAIRSLADPEQLEQQGLYASKTNGLLRRVNLSIGAGGKGEPLDQDGDGEVDEALEAKELQDIVSAELHVRLWGSRDRRDAQNFAGIVSAVRIEEREVLSAQISRVRDEIQGSSFNVETVAAAREKDPDIRDGCVARQTMRDWKPDVSSAVRQAKAVATAVRAKYATASAAVDVAPELSLFASAVERARAFGPDSLSAGVRYSAAKWNFNLDWTKVDLLDSEIDAEVYRAAFEYSTLWLRGRTMFGDGIAASAQGSYEKHSNVPDAKFDTTAKVGLSLDVPLAEGLSIPIGITWANHRALLDEGDETLGHLGLKFNLETLLKAAKAPGL